jgi:hypothetical protein
MPIATGRRSVTAGALVLALLGLPALRAQTTPPPDAKAVPVIDGDLGPCSAEFTVTDNAGAPIYAATIQVHIAYGFLSAYKLDLEVGTDANGKARFTGLPAKSKRGLFFRASKGTREGSAFDDPAKTCKAEFTIALEERKPEAQLRSRLQPLFSGSEVVDPRIALLLNHVWRMRPPSPMIILHLDADGGLTSSAGVGCGSIRGKTA